MTRQYLAEGIGRPEQYITVRSGMEVEPLLNAPPGHDCAHTREQLGIAPTDFVIGTVARLAELKGHDDLLDALAPDLIKNSGWKLLWVGDGWWRGRLLDKARSMGLTVSELDLHASPSEPPTASASQIILTGLVPPERIPDMIRAMDVLAHPSYREGLPRTVPQALLCGVCPVAYDVDGTGEVCREMQTGRLVPPGDRTVLREAIQWCYEHPGERAAMAARGRDQCAAVFSSESMVTALEAVYAAALPSLRDLGLRT